MTQNRVAEPVQVRVVVTGTQWVQAAATSTVGGYSSPVTQYVYYLPIMTLPPRVQVGTPILTVRGR